MALARFNSRLHDCYRSKTIITFRLVCFMGLIKPSSYLPPPAGTHRIPVRERWRQPQYRSVKPDHEWAIVPVLALLGRARLADGPYPRTGGTDRTSGCGWLSTGAGVAGTEPEGLVYDPLLNSLVRVLSVPFVN